MRRFLAFCLIALFVPMAAWARLGGGSSYSSSRSSSRSSSSSSGRSSSSSSGRSYSSGRSSSSSGSSRSSGGYSSGYSSGGSSYSSGDGGSILGILTFLFVGAVLLIVVLVIFWSILQQQMSASYSVATTRGPPASNEPKVDPLALVRAHDVNFSEPVFQAFLHLLFTRFHTERGRSQLPVLAAYMEASLLQARSNGPVGDILVGASRYLRQMTRASIPNGHDAVTVEFEATYSEGGKDFYTVEHWVLTRQRGVLSKDPEAMLNLGCPSCGNPGELGKDGRCPFCEQIVNRGTFQWKVQARTVQQLDPKPPMQLDSGGEEDGTDLPTVFQPNFEAERRAFVSRHPDFSWDQLRERIVNIFVNLQQAWSTLQFEKARPFETDVLYDTHRYWIDRYQSQGLRNALEQIQVRETVPCRLERDAFYERITVRIFAMMLDYTVDKQSQIVSGNAKKPRWFSEYWTFLRRIGSDAKTSADLSSCPHCGAPTQVSQAGICEHCSAHVASGQFDWVLSSIEQDESYTG